MNPRPVLCAALLAGCAPAAPQPVVIAPKPPVAAPPEEPKGARWLFTRAGVARAQWPIPGRGTLRVGEGGRRWIVRTDGSLEHAPRVAGGELVDVRFDGAGYQFVDDRGHVYLAADPLGSLETRRGPSGELVAAAAGKAAILGLERLGKLHRSTDGGATWSATPLPLRAGELVAGLATDRRGAAVALLHPQRVLVSRDDGATWSALATPGIGAHEVLRDANDAVWLQGATAAAKLGDAWSVGGEPAPLFEPSPPKTTSTTRVLAGERLVTMTAEKQASGYRLLLRTEPLGGAASEPFVVGDAADVPVVRFTGAGSTIVGELNEKTSTRIVRTTDDGRTWETLATFEGQRSWSHNIVAAPGWIAIGDICETGGKNCAGSRVKIGAADWQPLAVPGKSRLTAAVHDAPRDRILVIVDASKFYRASPNDATLTELAVQLPKEGRVVSGATIAADGTARILVVEDADSRWSIVRLAPDWSTQTVTTLPFKPDAIDLAGDRGLAFADHRAWETADGGEHWFDVGAGLDDNLQCATTGCLVGDAVRVGWDGGGGAAPVPPKDAPASAPKKSLSCVASGPWKTFPGEQPYAFNIALAGDVRYVAEPPPDFPKPDATTFTVVRAGEAPKKYSLLGPEPKGERTVRRWGRTTAEGYVLTRYSFEPATPTSGEKKYNPVDVELGWYNALTGKTGKAKLPKLPPFRVGSGGPSALTAIVDGGLLFMPYGSAVPLHYLRDDGKVEQLPRPKKLEGRAEPDSAFRDGARVVLAATEGPDVTLQMTADNGKTWQEATWTLGHDGRLVTHKGKPALLLVDRSELGVEERPYGVLPFDAVTADPPAMLPFASATKAVQSLNACAAPGGYRVKHPDGAEITVKVTAKDGSWTLTGNDSYAFVGETACVAAITPRDVESEDVAMAVIAPHDLAHSWLLKPGEDPFQHHARPMTCKLD